MIILGISAFYHDSAVALIKNGDILYAAQEERFSRKKHDPAFPALAMENALKTCNITLKDIDAVVFYEKPFLKFDRLISTYARFAPKGLKSFLSAMPVWFKEKLFIKQTLRDHTQNDKIFFVKHHEAHAASAFFPSPFPNAAIVTIDGVGEWDTTTLGYGENNHIHIQKTIRFPHSLGLLYSAFTYFNGFRVNSGEYKLMGLAPYGEPKYVHLIRDHLIDVKHDGSFRLNMDYFNYHVGLTMTNRRFDALFGARPRKPDTPIRPLDMDMAASVQTVLEDTVEKIATHATRESGQSNLVMAGGVALNCVANGKILRKNICNNIWIQPASGDAGGALGAALHLWHQHLNHPRPTNNSTDSQKGSYLGPSFSQTDIRRFLEDNEIPHLQPGPEQLPQKIAELLDQGHVIGVFQGRMEYGPRALGNRSIIGDARSTKMQQLMNLKIKFRESFRPFAPSLMAEKTGDYFDHSHPSPYMLLVYEVNPDKRLSPTPEQENQKGLHKLNTPRSLIPAVTHVDYSARVHTVAPQTNPLYHAIIKAFHQRTGCPVIINTSFNVRGEPIVNTPEQAYRVFQNTDMDYLLLDSFLVEKNDEDRKNIDYEWLKQFPPD